MIDKLRPSLTPLVAPVASPKLAPTHSTSVEPGESYVPSSPTAPVEAQVETRVPETPPAAQAPSPNQPLLQAVLTQAAADPESFLVADQARSTVQAYRHQAHSLVGGQEGLVEVTALNLMERDLSRVPTTLTVEQVVFPSFSAGLFPPTAMPANPLVPLDSAKELNAKKLGGMAACSAYTGALAAVLGSGPSTLTPGLCKLLSHFNPEAVFKNEGGGWRSLAAYQEVMGAVSTVQLPSGIELRGAWNERELALAESTFQDLEKKLPGSQKLIRSLTTSTYVAGRVDAEGNENFAVGGRFYGEGDISSQRPVGDGRAFQEVVAHEVGHAKDRELAKSPEGFASEEPGSPFLGTRDRSDYVSDYATTLGREDFAETHRDLVTNWNKIMKTSDLSLHANGALGEKRRYILESYGAPVPPPSERLKKALEAVESGQSPFGWKTPDGSKLGAKEDFQKAVKMVAASYDPDRPELNSMILGMSPKTRWIAEHLLGEVVSPPSFPPLPSGPPGGLMGGMGFGLPALEMPQDLTQLQADARDSVSAMQRYDNLGRELDAKFEAGDATLEQACLSHRSHYLARIGLAEMQGRQDEVEKLLSQASPALRQAVQEGQGSMAERIQKLNGEYSDRLMGTSAGPGGFAYGANPLQFSSDMQQLFALQSEAMGKSFGVITQMMEGGTVIRQALKAMLPDEVVKDPLLRRAFEEPPEPVMGRGY